MLNRRNISATFFVLGENVDRPGGWELINRIRQEGHRVGNHTYTHSILFGLEEDQSKVIMEIDRTQNALREHGTERLFRPFGGGGTLDERVMSRTALKHLEAQGYTIVLWNSVPGDWTDPAGWPETALVDLLTNEWTVTVVHDLPTGAMNELDRFIEMALSAGAEFRNDFPPEVVPLVKGRQVLPMDHILSGR